MNNTINGLLYDFSLENNITMYDHLPYERNLSVCGNDCIKQYSGNVIKYATYDSERKYEVPTNEEMLIKRIQREKKLQETKAQLESADPETIVE